MGKPELKKQLVVRRWTLEILCVQVSTPGQAGGAARVDARNWVCVQVWTPGQAGLTCKIVELEINSIIPIMTVRNITREWLKAMWFSPHFTH